MPMGPGALLISMKTGRRNEGQFLIRVSFELATSLKVLRNLKVVRRASHYSPRLADPLARGWS
jgi:hypothetical protein